jgi:hypothetical protein
VRFAVATAGGGELVRVSGTATPHDSCIPKSLFVIQNEARFTH